MAATSAVPFQWGNGGRKITTPEQAARQRLVAEALMLSGKSPAANWAQGLGDVTGALTGSVLNNEVMAAEEAGAIEASGLFQGLTSASPESDIISALNNPWMSDTQSGVARALLGDQLNVADAGSDLPANIREWEYFNGLTPEEQSQYLIMKRANPYLDQGTQFTQNDPLNPGQTLGAPVPKFNTQESQQKAVGTALGTAQGEIIDAGRNARANNAKLDILAKTLETAPQGAAGALVQAAGSIGIPMEGLDDVQAANAIISQMVPLQRVPGSGTMSDQDLALFKQSLPAIINQPGGNKKIIDTLRAVNDYMAEAGAIETDLALGRIDAAEYEKRFKSLSNPLANFNASGAANPNAVVPKKYPGVTIEVMDE
jgi:hypothetical protein